MSDRLKVGLIGAGVFAGYHANKLAAHPRVSFTGVMDRSANAAKKLAEKHGVQAMSLQTLYETSDAVIIASPASTHGAIAIQALQAGCHCLIEKPIATTVEEAERIVELAKEKNLKVQVGHQERLVIRAIGLEEVDEKPLKIEAVRNSTYSRRGTDTSVTLDLMTHDIDLCSVLIGQLPEHQSGAARCVRSETPDMSHTTIAYRGPVARLEASRVAEKIKRRMKITYPSGIVDIDFIGKTLTNSTSFKLNENFGEDERAKDSLGAATDIFVRAVLDDTAVLVSAFNGALAAKIAIQLDELR